MVNDLEQVESYDLNDNEFFKVISNFLEGKSIPRRRYLMRNYNLSDYSKKLVFDKEKIKLEDVIKEIKDLKNLLILSNIDNLFNHINKLIRNIFYNNICYIAPLRATAERYYRIQGLAVDEINLDGNNLPMFLKNLSERDFNNFADWTEKYFNFRPALSNRAGHISLEIKINDKKINLTDTGFGFSQILPIILQIWYKIYFSSSETRRRFVITGKQIFFVIEQPELHLHPAMQGMLIDVIIKSIKVAKKKEIDIRFILETHSETMVNRISRHILEGSFNQEDSKIIIFNNENNKLEIQETKYNIDGEIEKWPLGFFGPEDIIL